MEPYQQENEATSIFNELESQYIERGTRGQRFANYLIDLIAIYGVQFLFGMLYGVILIKSGSYYDNTNIGQRMIIYLLNVMAFFLYYLLCENIFKGVTLGKLIIGTIAIRDDNQLLTFRNVVIRSLCRLIPFEPFSGFSELWHGTLSDTKVVKRAGYKQYLNNSNL